LLAWEPLPSGGLSFSFSAAAIRTILGREAFLLPLPLFRSRRKRTPFLPLGIGPLRPRSSFLPFFLRGGWGARGVGFFGFFCDANFLLQKDSVPFSSVIFLWTPFHGFFGFGLIQQNPSFVDFDGFLANTPQLGLFLPFFSSMLNAGRPFLRP